MVLRFEVAFFLGVWIFLFDEFLEACSLYTYHTYVPDGKKEKAFTAATMKINIFHTYVASSHFTWNMLCVCLALAQRVYV